MISEVFEQIWKFSQEEEEQEQEQLWPLLDLSAIAAGKNETEPLSVCTRGVNRSMDQDRFD